MYWSKFANREKLWQLRMKFRAAHENCIVLCESDSSRSCNETKQAWVQRSVGKSNILCCTAIERSTLFQCCKL